MSRLCDYFNEVTLKQASCEEKMFQSIDNRYFFSFAKQNQCKDAAQYIA